MRHSRESGNPEPIPYSKGIAGQARNDKQKLKSKNKNIWTQLTF